MKFSLTLLSATIIAAALDVTALCSLQSVSAAGDKRAEAIALYNKKDYRRAALLLEDYLTVNNRDPYAAYYAALANHQIGNSSKACMYYRQVFNMAPKSQIGAYAKDMLVKLDPSFAASLIHSTSVDQSIPSTEEGLAKAIIALPSGEESARLDPALPSECRIPFKTSPQGMYLDCYIDGRPIAMEFDSAAPNVVLSKSNLQTLGIAAPTGRSDGFTARTASSEPTAFWIIHATVKVGQIEVRDTPIKVMDSDHFDPSLGQTFFKNFDCTIDDAAGQINLRQKALSAMQSKNGTAVGVPFAIKEEGNRILVTVEIDGKPTPMIFDPSNTANACACTSTALAEKAGFKIPDGIRPTVQLGVNGLSYCKTLTARRMHLGPIDRTEVSITVFQHLTDPPGIDAPLLGQPFWQGYEYTIDMKKKLIYFVRR